MKLFKKIISAIMVAVMLICSAPLDGLVGLDIDWSEFGFEASAADELATMGQCGDDVWWMYSKDTGSLVIAGQGDMWNYEYDSTPFREKYILEVEIDNGVTSIGDYAFYCCSKLSRVEIPNTVTSIGDCAFFYCRSLTSIEIPDSITSIGGDTFYGCESLTSIEIPDSVTDIGVYAFNGCTKLESITISDGVTHIGHSAFAETKYYTNNENWKNGVLYINNYLIKATNTVPAVYEIKEGTKIIADYAFEECAKLESITIVNSVTSIGTGAFYGCGRLSNITIPDNVTQIGSSAFAETKYYTNNENWENGVLYINNYLIKATNKVPAVYEIKDGTKIIADYAFEECAKLESITIPDGVTHIGLSAFYDCTSLKSVELPRSVTNIGTYAFLCCCRLVGVEIPDSVTAIGDGAFSQCNDLISVEIGNSVTHIARSMFAWCDSLTSVVIPSSVTSIDAYAFEGCDSLTDVYYSGSVKEWNKIMINSGNESLTDATIHFNSQMPEEEPEVLKLNHSELTIKNNATPYLIVSQYPDGVTEDDIVWTSSNERVACIYNHIVHPIQYGKTLVTASTMDGKYSASCEVTVQSSFVITSTTNSLHSIEKGQQAEYSIMLLNYEGNKLPVKDVEISNGDSSIAKIVKEERTETEIKLTIEGLKTGTAIFSIKNDEPLTFNRFVFEVYPKSVTYRADKIPVTNSKLGTNFSRSGMYVENFEYSYSELADCYFANMTVYNKNSTPGVIVSYTQDGEIYEIVSIKEHQTLPTDYFDFLTVLGKGAVDIATLNTYNYRYSVESTKSEIEIKVPENGYITFSNDILSCPVALVYGTISVAVDTAFQLLGDVTDVINYDRSKKNDVVKELTKKVTDYFKEETEFLEDLVKEYAKEIVKKTSKQNIVDIGKFSLDVAEKIYKEAGLDFEETLITVLEKMYKSSVREFLENSALKYFIDKKAIASSVGGYIKAGEIMFNVAEHVNVTDQIIDLMHSSKSGVTTITFGRCNEGGFVCKDVVSVNLKEEKEILDSLYLQHYQIYSENKNDLLSRPGLKELNLKENAEIEVHEITIMRDGVPYEIQQTVTVEIDLPAGWAPFNFRIYRVEPNGKLTDMHAVVVNGKAIFETDHFSEYIFVGEILDEHTHDYEETVTNPTCTEGGYTTYTCACGDSYIADETPALGHTESVWITDSNPTCTTEGSKHIECTVCEEILRTEAIPVIEHSYNAVVTAPTCTAKGYTTYTCACGDTYVSDYVAETDHNYNNSGICTECGADRAENCFCNCHKDGFIGFIWKILRFFYKIFGTNRICDCGIAHY